MKIIVSLIFVIILTGCKDKSPQEKRLLVDDSLLAVGQISDDTIYSGLVKFYDPRSSKILYSCNYKDGKLDGIKTDFHENGEVYSRQMYHGGLPHGYVNFYDTAGQIYARQFFYYGLKSGPSINWKDGQPTSFHFYSLDNRLLIDLDYSDLTEKLISDVQQGFFFYQTSEVITANWRDGTSAQKDIFLYLPKPPKFDFKYSLVKIDSQYKVLSIIREISSNDIFEKISVPASDTASLAIRLIVDDAIHEGTHTMFKKL
ncbi:hypothetical protein LZZ85_26320 [Terrimonas sp. NA20]|uniref:Uncharacterized protein n=1 Tax=Terrimonas ginsenosidimutans TaxID=2908004 RepID=A0ABS9L019_9BACT|nr:hypothetical protein [Terrimonas ginsenosidimutans]MCG2617844.1 hypothetical protein [Terrimonas ginsenosidimutans]